MTSNGVPAGDPPTPQQTGEEEAAPRFWRLLIGGSSRVASQRLTASVECFVADLKYLVDCQPELLKRSWYKIVNEQLETVRAHHRRGEIDAAWYCFTAAARRETENAGPVELTTRANALRREAESGKLSSAWRSKTISDLLETAEIEGKLLETAEIEGKLFETKEIEGKLPEEIDEVRWRLNEATRLRDEDAANKYYKVALVRGQRSLLLLILLGCIAIILGLAAAVDWAGDLGDPSVGFAALVAAFGTLGACMSAIQSLGRAGAGGRIPEHVASSLITITRPTLGAAAALGVYAIAASGLLNISLNEQEAHLTILALAFAAGFSERLVLSAVGTATGGLEREEKG